MLEVAVALWELPRPLAFWPVWESVGRACLDTPVRFPDPVVFKSLYEVPICLLLLPYLRSEKATRAFDQKLFRT